MSSREANPHPSETPECCRSRRGNKQKQVAMHENNENKGNMRCPFSAIADADSGRPLRDAPLQFELPLGLFTSFRRLPGNALRPLRHLLLEA